MCDFLCDGRFSSSLRMQRLRHGLLQSAAAAAAAAAASAAAAAAVCDYHHDALSMSAMLTRAADSTAASLRAPA
jgi:hypothetical protein